VGANVKSTPLAESEIAKPGCAGLLFLRGTFEQAKTPSAHFQIVTVAKASAFTENESAACLL